VTAARAGAEERRWAGQPFNSKCLHLNRQATSSCSPRRHHSTTNHYTTTAPQLDLHLHNKQPPVTHTSGCHMDIPANPSSILLGASKCFRGG
jgi:hypothetical protein